MTNDIPPSVSIAEQPVKVKIEQEEVKLVSSTEKLDKAPDTTAEENLHSKSQRDVNRLWERTQAIISIAVTLTACVVIIILVLRQEYSISLQLLSSMVFLVLGFYYSRTNHANVGGVKLPYQGR